MASAFEEEFVPELPELELIPGTNVPEGWRHASRPNDLVEFISSEYSAEDRLKLADAAAQVALTEVKDAYMSPFIRATAQRAARLALGLTPLPEQPNPLTPGKQRALEAANRLRAAHPPTEAQQDTEAAQQADEEKHVYKNNPGHNPTVEN